jgi:hypothetical protein
VGSASVTTVTYGRAASRHDPLLTKEDDMDDLRDITDDTYVRWDGLHAIKLGPFNRPVRIKVRAYSDHYQGGPASTAWMKLFYDRDEVGGGSGQGDPIPLEVVYYLGLMAGNSADFRIDFGNHGSTVQDFGYELWLRPL